MKIGIIGAGYVGRGVAQLAANDAHDVMISNSRDPRSLHSVVGTLQRDAPDGVTIAAGTANEAAAFGEMVLIALPLYAYKDLPVEALAGKTVLDATNDYPDRDGIIPELDSGATTTGELIAWHLPGSRIVKCSTPLPRPSRQGPASRHAPPPRPADRW